MTIPLAPQIPPHTTFHTTRVPEPFLVRLAGVTHGDHDVVTVRDQVVIDGRIIVRSAAGEGFWRVDVDRPSDGAIPTAQFEPHPTVCFSFPRR